MANPVGDHGPLGNHGHNPGVNCRYSDQSTAPPTTTRIYIFAIYIIFAVQITVLCLYLFNYCYNYYYYFTAFLPVRANTTSG